MPLDLDRMRLDDVGADPELLAEAVHEQLPELAGPVPVREIARALDVEEIREEPLLSIEGALIAPPERGHGAILVNSRSSPQRRRYTIGHELGHFLNPLHEPTRPSGFACTWADMAVACGSSRHLQQEAEANRFAIALLAPCSLVAPYLSGPADLRQALGMARALDISKTAAVRRYVELHPERLAAVFSRDGTVLYADRQDGFPFLSVWTGDRLPGPPDTSRPCVLEWRDVDTRDWLKAGHHVRLCAQTLQQANGYAVTILRADSGEMDCYAGVQLRAREQP